MFDYLLKISGGQLLLTPEQLSKVANIDTKQQSVLRNKKEFPIRFKKIGKLVFYSISDVVDYMLTGSSQVVKEEKKDAVKEVVIERNRKVVKNASHIFMMKSFASVLQKESQELLELSYNLVKYSESIELYEKLNTKLSRKNTTQIKREF